MHKNVSDKVAVVFSFGPDWFKWKCNFFLNQPHSREKNQKQPQNCLQNSNYWKLLSVVTFNLIWWLIATDLNLTLMILGKGRGGEGSLGGWRGFTKGSINLAINYLFIFLLSLARKPHDNNHQGNTPKIKLRLVSIFFFGSLTGETEWTTSWQIINS